MVDSTVVPVRGSRLPYRVGRLRSLRLREPAGECDPAPMRLDTAHSGRS
jgi:hypothetical protein